MFIINFLHIYIDYIFPDSKTITGTPWEMRQHDGYIIREKAGYIYGYDSYVAMVPEIRLGEYSANALLFSF